MIGKVRVNWQMHTEEKSTKSFPFTEMQDASSEALMMTRTEVMTILGKTVKSRRLELGISQEELADRAGLHRTYISDVERGERNVSLVTLKRMACALEMTMCELVANMDGKRCA